MGTQTQYKVQIGEQIRSSFDYQKIADIAQENNISINEIESEVIDVYVPDAFQVAKLAEYNKYLQRREDGIRMFLELMAELRLSSQANNLPRTWLRGLESAFAKVQTAVESGQWITAKEECELVAIESPVNQQIYDRIYISITNYVDQNYV